MKYRLQDLIDIEHFQELQDRLNEIYSFPSSIIDNDGNILTATAWQEICTKFHRKNKDAEKICIKSDQYIKDHIHEANPALSYQCPHGLVDNATPIIIDGTHYGNFFTGQFFLAEPNLEFFRSQAQKYGFDEEAYLRAVKKVPIWTQEQLDSYLFFIKGLIAVISESGLKKLKEIENRKRIQKSEERYRSILKAAMDGYWVTDTQGRLLEVNDAYCSMSGYSEAELLTMRIADLEVVETSELVAKHMQKVVQVGNDRFESKHRRKDGTLFYVEVSVQFRAEDGGQCVCFLRDITEPKKVEDTLRKNEETYRDLLDNLNAGVVVHAPDTSIMIANQSACKMLGLSNGQLSGKEATDPHWKFLRDDGSDMPFMEYPVNRVLSTQKDLHNQVVGVKRPGIGNISWLLVNGFPVFKDAETIEQVVINFVEITEMKQAQQAVIAANEKMKLAADSAQFGIWDLDIKKNQLEWDDWMFRLYGIDRDKFGGAYEAWQAGVHHDDLERSSKEVELALRGEKEFETEFRIVRPDGEIRQIKAYAAVSRDSRGEPIKMTGINYDITDRKQAEEDLEEAKIFLDNMSDLAYIADDKGNVLWVNTVAEQLTGLPPERIIGKPFLPLFIEEDHASLMNVYQKTLKGEALENTLTFKTGTTCHFTSLPKRTKHGDIIGTFGVARNITESLRMEQALKDSEQMYRTTFDAIPDSITVTRQKDGRYKYVNEGFCNITGYSQAEVIGKTPLEIDLYVNHSDRKRMVQSLRQNGELLNFEIPFRKKDGTVWDSYFSARPIVIDGENCLIALTKDVTELKRAEGEKARLETQLRQAQKMESVGRLAGGVAHDFNNMLSVILGNTEMILEEIEADNSFYANLHEILKAAKRSADVTRQLLAFARKQAIAPRILDLNETLANLLNMLRRLIGEDIELVWLPASNAGRVRLDPSQLDQILANLCVNARDAISGVGKIIFETCQATIDEMYCESHPGLVPGNYVLLAVSDDGKGMDKEILDNLFEPFYTTKEIDKGTGLGLATVYGIVKQNKGFINVYSEPNEGTSFKIYLPRHGSDEGQEHIKPQAEQAARGNETILLVEDESSILKMTAQMLKRLGYTVLTAVTPREAINLAREYDGDIHLLMTDVVMPEMNGRDLAKNLLSIYPNLNCLFMSGYTANVIAHHGVLDEGVNFIQKPFSKQELSVKVREVLDDAKS